MQSQNKKMHAPEFNKIIDELKNKIIYGDAND
jgi:hypothetical protein